MFRSAVRDELQMASLAIVVSLVVCGPISADQLDYGWGWRRNACRSFAVIDFDCIPPCPPSPCGPIQNAVPLCDLPGAAGTGPFNPATEAIPPEEKSGVEAITASELVQKLTDDAPVFGSEYSDVISMMAYPTPGSGVTGFTSFASTVLPPFEVSDQYAAAFPGGGYAGGYGGGSGGGSSSGARNTTSAPPSDELTDLQPVPEPSTGLLLAGLILVFACARKRFAS